MSGTTRTPLLVDTLDTQLRGNTIEELLSGDPTELLAELMSGPLVTIVGSRASTAYGDAVASQLAYDLARSGVTVMVEAGWGIADHALRGAASSGRRSIALMGAGVTDKSAPFEAARRYDGAILVSTFPAGTLMSRSNIAARGEIVAATTGALVVVEAGIRSSALRVAELCKLADTPVYAVPGPITSAASEGPHRLLSDGTAKILTGAADMGDLTQYFGRPLQRRS